jgi:hypothetical protein
MDTYYFHNDPGHGWLAVPKVEADRLGLLDKITPYSYDNGLWLYLEEDCDAPLFLKAKKDAGEPVQFIEVYHDTDAPVRNYPSFHPRRVSSLK